MTLAEAKGEAVSLKRRMVMYAKQGDHKEAVQCFGEMGELQIKIAIAERFIFAKKT